MLDYESNGESSSLSKSVYYLKENNICSLLRKEINNNIIIYFLIS